MNHRQDTLPLIGNRYGAAVGNSDLIAVICNALNDNHCLSHIARATGIPLKRLMNLCNANGLSYPYKQATPRQIAEAVAAVVERGLTVRAAAKEVGISKSSVHRHVATRRRQIVRKSGDFQPKQVEPYRCPRHGRMILKPCPACAALEAAARR